MERMLDTNICIYIIKRQPPQVLKRLVACNVSDVCVSTITISELAYGISKSVDPQKNRDALSGFLVPLEILAFDDDAAFHYGEIRAHLEKKGKSIGAMDMLIAAHARSLGLTLVTNNAKEFRRVPGLSVENWV